MWCILISSRYGSFRQGGPPWTPSIPPLDPLPPSPLRSSNAPPPPPGSPLSPKEHLAHFFFWGGGIWARVIGTVTTDAFRGWGQDPFNAMIFKEGGRGGIYGEGHFAMAWECPTPGNANRRWHCTISFSLLFPTQPPIPACVHFQIATRSLGSLDRSNSTKVAAGCWCVHHYLAALGLGQWFLNRTAEPGGANVYVTSPVADSAEVKSTCHVSQCSCLVPRARGRGVP